MNKEVKQLLIKFAVIVGVIILSAFITVVSAEEKLKYFTPKNGDDSVVSDAYVVPDNFYSYNDFITNKYLCDAKGTTLSTKNKYEKNSNADVGYAESGETRTAIATLGDYRAKEGYSITFSNGDFHLFALDVKDLKWGPPASKNSIGTQEITVQYLEPKADGSTVRVTKGYTEDFEYEDTQTDIDLKANIISKSYTPAWQQDGGLGSGDLAYVLVNKNDYLSSKVTLSRNYYQRVGANTTFDHSDTVEYSYKALFMEDVWNQMIKYSEDYPVYTSTLGNQHPAGESANSDPTDVIFQYIYAEASASSDGEPYSPVQYANWFALGQQPTSEETVDEMMKYIEIEDEEEKEEYKKKLEQEVGLKLRIGFSMYQEAVHYKKFLAETDGKLVKEFIDVKDENGNVVPAQIKGEADGTIVVGPFAMNYTERGIDAGRGWAQFAGIYDFVLTTNDKPDPANPLGEDEFEIVFEDKDRQTNNLVKPYYPHSNEKFYIKIKRAEGRTSFRDFNFKMRYLNVTGSAVEIVEDLYYYKWTIGEVDGNYCIKGSLYKGPVRQQNQSVQIQGSRTYVHDNLHYGMYPVYLSLTKTVANGSDNNNTMIQTAKGTVPQQLAMEKSYRFKIDIYATRDGAVNAGKVGDGFEEPLYTYEMNLLAGQTDTITQYFPIGTELPYFRITETYTGEADEVTFKIAGRDEDDNTRFTNGICGRFTANSQTSVECINSYILKSAKLTLSKKVAEKAVEEEVYKLNVAITDNAKYILEDYSSPLKNSVELRVPEGQTEAEVYIGGKPTGKKSIDFYYVWWGNDDQTKIGYKVTEEENAKYKVIFNGNQVDKVEGQFENGFKGEVKVTAENHRAKSKIWIDKTTDKDMLAAKNYFFRIKVGSSFNKEVQLTVPKGEHYVKSDVFTVVLDDKNGDKYQVFEYPDEDSMLKDSENGTLRAEGVLKELSTADWDDASKFTKVSLENEIDKLNIKYLIKKTFEENQTPKDDLVFTFDTNALFKGEEIQHDELKASMNNNWTTGQVEVEWDYGPDNPVITIKEAQDQEYFVNGLKIYNEKSGNEVVLSSEEYSIKNRSEIVINEKGINKLLEAKGYDDDVQFVFEIKNKAEYSAKIVLKKSIEGIAPSDDKEYSFKFKVIVDGVEEIVTASNKHAFEKIVTWEDENYKPKVEIYEINQEGSELVSVIINGNTINKSKEDKEKPEIPIYNGTVSIENPELLIDVTNSFKQGGTINIKKTLLDRNGKEIVDSSKVFSFIIKVDGKEPETVKVSAGKSTPYSMTWNAGEEGPEFEISEIAIDGYAIKKENGITISPDGAATNTGGIVKGKFANNAAIDVTYINEEVITLNGTVTVAKKVVSTSGADIPDDYDKKFKFKVIINDAGADSGEEEIQLGSGETYSKSVSWKSNEPTPTYSIQEVDNGNLKSVTKDGEIITVVAGTVTGSFINNSSIHYEYTNGEDVHKGKLSLTKALMKETNYINDDFFFDITIAGNKIDTVILNAGETWESDIYTWIGDNAPTYTIIEEEPSSAEFHHFEVNGDVYKPGPKESPRSVTGTLTDMEYDEDSVKVVCYNEVYENKANAKIVKKGIATDLKNVTDQQLREDYYGTGFIIDVAIVYDDGDFYINGEKYNAEKPYKTQYILGIGEEQQLPEITWFGNNKKGPKIIVHETITNEGWTLLNINNNNVVLEPNANETITIENEWSSIRLILMPMGGTVWQDIIPDTKNGKADGAMNQDEVGIPGVGVVVKRYLVDKDNKIIAETGNAKAYNIDGSEINVYPIYTDETGRWDIRGIEIPGLTSEEINKGAAAAKYGVEYIYDGYNYEPTIYIAGLQNDYTDIQRARVYDNYDKNAMAQTRDTMLDNSFAKDKSDSRTAFNSQFKIISGDTSIAGDNSTSGYAIGGTNNNRLELKYKGTIVKDQFGNERLVSELVTTGANGRVLPEFQVTAYTLFNQSNPVGSKVGDTGLAYPFDLNFNVALSTRQINKDIYVATDPYLRNINLGLVRRDDADIEVTKDVTSAKVIVNQTVKDYQFSKLHSVSSDGSHIQLDEVAGEGETVSYSLGLYKTDYYYRAQAYATNSDVYNGLKTFYKDILRYQNEDLETLMNMQAYVTYTIRVRNASPSEKYDIGVRSIIDYSDSSLELVKSDVTNFIKDSTGATAGRVETVAKAPQFKLKTDVVGNNGQIEIHVIDVDGLDPSIDKAKYTTIKDKATSRSYNRTEFRFVDNTNNNNNEKPLLVGPNEYVDITATYRIKKYGEDLERTMLQEYEENNLNAINSNGLELGDKANIAEIKSYSVFKVSSTNRGTYYAGKVDKDSAPNNLDIMNKNKKEFYEDDSYSAPTITIDIDNTDKNKVTGTVWEDNEIVDDTVSKGVALGNGRLDAEENTISGMNIELVEKIQIPTSGADGSGNYTNYYEYDFTWPEYFDVQKNTIVNPDEIKVSGSDKIDGIENTLKVLTGFDSTIASAEDGNYSFVNAPAGNYIVRFHYGDNNGGYTNRSVSFISASNLTEGDIYKFPAGGDKMQISSYAETQPTKTSKYDGDILPAVYNGQDFKSALYNLDINAEWLDNNAENISKAADSQARRLEVVNKSRVLTNTNTTIFATANEIDANHEKLYDEYRMFADTPKIKFNEESKEYNNVGFGVVERPETRLVLDKEIEKLVLRDNTHSDNNNHALIEINYDIDYSKPNVLEQKADGSFILKEPAAAVSMNTEKSFGTEYLQSLSKSEEKYGFLEDKAFNTGVQNFRYIVYDTSMATSLTLEITYRITALDLGQADRTTVTLQNMTSEEINAIAQVLKANKFSNNVRTYDGESYGAYTVVGNSFGKSENGRIEITNRFTDILGNTYYKGDFGNDIMVKTKVGQVIDYVDNTLEFDQSINTAIDGSWAPTTDDYLYNNDIIDKSIFETVNYNLLQGDAATSEMNSKVVDKDGRYYDSHEKHNIILSVTNVNEEANNNTNPHFLQEMVTPAVNGDNIILSNKSGEKFNGEDLTFNSTSAITLRTTKTIDAQKEDLIFDNIAEIIRYENKVGRRTTTTVAGNADPRGAYTYEGTTTKLGEFAGALKEIDSSATEIITFSNPYGISDRTRYITEITIGIFSALVIVAVGIVVVKKKVL